VVFIGVAALFLFNGSFSETIITGFLRPETAFTFVVVLGGLSALLLFLFLLQSRKKKLKSTKQLSDFAKTVVCDALIRKMSVTQVFYEPNTSAKPTALKNRLVDVSVRNPNIKELYFNFEADLTI
jgi:hypothetical protein